MSILFIFLAKSLDTKIDKLEHILEIAEIFHNKELMTTKKIVDVLKDNGIKTVNLDEKVHIIIGMVENYCHEIVYHHHKSLNYKVMKEEVIKIISTVLKG